MSARSIASFALISAFLLTPSAVGQISFYDISSGAFSSSTNPMLTGGPYIGFTVAQVFATPGIKVNVRGTSGTELVITDNNGSHYYDVSTGAFFNTNNATLTGGPYAGQTKGQVFASGALINDRNQSGSQLVITNVNGNHYYDASTGTFSISSNPTLSGGPYAGKTIGQLFTEGVAIRVQAGAQPNLVIADGAGNHFYDDSTGAFSVSQNPTLAGGPFAGQTVGQAFIAGSFVDVRETAGAELSLTTRTLPASTTSLSASPSGTATLSSPVTLTATVTPSSATGKVAFFDGVEVLGYATLTSGQATFTTRRLASGVRQLRAMYTGNGSVAVSTSSPASYTITSIAGAGFRAVQNYPAGSRMLSMAIADIDLDGDADVIVLNNVASGTVQVLRNNGNGTLAAAIPITVHADPYSLTVGDFNEDGIPDIVVGHVGTSNDIAVLFGNGDGTFQTPAYLAVDARSQGLQVADFNDDGHADIGVAVTAGFGSPNEFSVFLGNGNGTFQTKRDTATGGANSTYIATGYFNGDNIVDVAVVNTSSGNVSVLLGNGTGGFNPAPSSPFPVATLTGGMINLGDINSDGFTDLAVGINGAPSVGIYLGNGTGQFSSSGTFPAGFSPRDMASGDFNGDGRSDLVISNIGGTVRVLTGMPGSPYFTLEAPISVAPVSGQATRVADLNGDGAADIVVSDFGNAGVGVLLAVGPPASITPTNGTPQSVLLGSSFPIQFRAVVRDSGGTSLPNISVTFNAPVSGASCAFSGSATVITDASGVAIAPVCTANTTAGTYTVTASVSGVATPASFTLTNAVPASITATAGTPQSAAVGNRFGFVFQAVVRDGAGDPLSGASVTFTAPASGASGTFATSPTVTTDSSGRAIAPGFTANSTLGTYVVEAFVTGVATPASFMLTNSVAVIDFYNYATGAHNISRAPLLSGGPLNGLYLPQVLGTGARIDVRDSFGSELFVFNATGAHAYSVQGGTYTTSYNPTLSGGPYNGQTVGQVFSSGKILQARDGITQNFVILDSAGAHLYTFATGAFGISRNPTITGGPAAYVGQTLGSLVSSGAHISIRESSGQEVVITDASGIHTYRMTDGLFNSSRNPTLSGGPHDGMTAAQAFSAGLVLRISDTAASNLVLFTEQPPGPPATITAISGTPQSTPAGTAFPAPFKAEVRDAANRVVPGVNVTFTAPASGASCVFSGSATVMTDLNGVATAPTCTANSTAGAYNVAATVSGVATPASFSLTNTPGAAGSIAIVSGSPQSTHISTAFPAPLVVIVRDSVNNPVPGVTVTFAAPGSGASAALSSPTAITNASGQASITATASAAAGSYSVTASVSGVSTQASFNLTNVQPPPPPPSSISASGGGSQSTIVNTPFGAALVVTVKDSGGNPVSGVTVTFAVPTSGASATLSSATATTNANGQASVTATANGFTGTYGVTATVSGAAGTATFNLTNTVGAPAQIAISGGNSQSAQINTAFANALQIVVKDPAGNPVPNVTVTFAVPASGASATLSSATTTTNASGVASVNATANNTAGSYSVTASAGSGISVAFSLANTAGAPSALTIVGGNSQSAPINMTFGQALEVELRDASGNFASGVTVTFTAPATGASATLSSTTALTNAQGRASITAIANSTAGTYDVTASIAGAAAPVAFHLTNTSGAPTAIEPADGGACGGGSSSPSSNQSTQIFSSFPLALGVKVIDSNCNPVAGVSVTFTAPSAGASAILSATTVTTGANGIASVTARANNIADSYFVAASISGVTNGATFRLTNTPGAPSSISATGGTPQSARINTAFANSLQLVVRDAGGNPVPGSTVTFSVPGSGAAALLSATTAVTDTQGRVSITAAANSVTGSYDVLASVTGGATPASFHLTNTAGAPAEVTPGDGGASGGCSASGPINSLQSAEVLTAFALPLSVTVRDAACNPVPGVSVTFAVPASGPSASLSTVTAITDAQGVASVNATANIAIGTYPVTASVTGVSAPAVFNLTNIAGKPGSIAPAEGSASTPQSTRIETSFAKPLTVTVTDAQGNPISGATVTFSVPASGAAAVLSSATATIDAQGNASVTATANSVAGSYVVTAYVPGVAAPASFQLTNTPGVPTGITSDGASACAGVSGPFSSTQSTRINALFSLPLQVAVFDAKCNPVPGVAVSFAAPGSGASAVLSAASAVTDADGIARVYAKANATAGSYQPSATVAGVTPAVFNLTNTPGTPGSIVIKSGSPQTTSVSAAFANPLVAVVKDSGGNPLSGVVVTFAAPAGAIQLSSTTATTNAQGEVSITATAGTIAGSYFVSASTAGVSTSAFFYLTATAGPAARIVPGGGGDTTNIPAQPNGPFSSPLALTVLDANGNPVSDVPVTFTVTGPCNLSGTSVTTDAQGRVAITGVAGATPGICEITASVPGIAEPIRFRVTITSQVTLHAVTDAASFQLRAAPGALMTIFGVNLANPASLPDGKQIMADKYPLPTTLGGVTLTVNGVAAPLLYVSPTQVNFQLPQELELELKEVDGIKQMWVKVVVTHDGTNSGEMMMRVTEAAPAIFSIAPDFRRAAAENLDLSVNTAENPVAPGSYIVMFATGQGTTQPHVPTGQPAPADKLAWSIQPVSATIAGRAVEVQYGGLAPGFAGLLQVNLRVPEDIAGGEHPVVIIINGVASKPATIFVGSRPSAQP